MHDFIYQASLTLLMIHLTSCMLNFMLSTRGLILVKSLLLSLFATPTPYIVSISSKVQQWDIMFMLFWSKMWRTLLGNYCADFMAKLEAYLDIVLLYHAPPADLLNLFRIDATETFYYRDQFLSCFLSLSFLCCLFFFSLHCNPK